MVDEVEMERDSKEKEMKLRSESPLDFLIAAAGAEQEDDGKSEESFSGDALSADPSPGPIPLDVLDAENRDSVKSPFPQIFHHHHHPHRPTAFKRNIAIERALAIHSSLQTIQTMELCPISRPLKLRPLPIVQQCPWIHQ